MNLFEFLKKLENFYPLNESQDKVNNRLSSYVDILEGEIVKSGKSYDYDKVLKHIQINYRYKQFPSLPDIIDFLKVGIVNTYVQSKDEGKLIVVTLPNGARYEFTVCGFASHDLNYYEGNIKKKFGQATVEIYPKEAQFVGDELFWNIEIPNAENIDSAELAELERAKKQELEKQVIKYEIK